MRWKLPFPSLSLPAKNASPTLQEKVIHIKVRGPDWRKFLITHEVWGNANNHEGTVGEMLGGAR